MHLQLQMVLKIISRITTDLALLGILQEIKEETGEHQEVTFGGAAGGLGQIFLKGDSPNPLAQIPEDQGPWQDQYEVIKEAQWSSRAEAKSTVSIVAALNIWQRIV